jgi:hypothetical protein
MAHQTIWYPTFMDEKIMDALDQQISQDKISLYAATIGQGEGEVELKTRNSGISWLDTSHWIAPLIWYYVERANRENFRYDIKTIDGESMQYTSYGPGQFYGWHRDDSLANKSSWSPANGTSQRPDWDTLSGHDTCRKLSFSLLLNDPSEYEGGQFQMMGYNNHMYEVPQQKGLLVIFDSTTLHRVRPVKKGTRRSLVGWVLGPRWR